MFDVKYTYLFYGTSKSVEKEDLTKYNRGLSRSLFYVILLHLRNRNESAFGGLIGRFIRAGRSQIGWLIRAVQSEPRSRFHFDLDKPKTNSLLRLKTWSLLLFKGPQISQCIEQLCMRRSMPQIYVKVNKI